MRVPVVTYHGVDVYSKVKAKLSNAIWRRFGIDVLGPTSKKWSGA